MKELKRVLIITYYWPPSGGSGVQRWLKFAKYLPQLGWQPVIVAPKDADYEVTDESLAAEIPAEAEVIRLPIREPYALYRSLTGTKPGQALVPSGGSSSPSLLKRLSLWVRANFFVPDPKIWWVDPSVKALKTYLQAHPVDAIITTGPPHSVHLIGLALKRALPKVPWQLDVRDPWSQFDVHLSFNPGKRARAKNARLERECLAAADVVLGTAPSMPDNLEPFDKKKYVCITNGFDAEDFPKQTATSDANSAASFTIYHTGLLSAARNPDALWAALAQLCVREEGFAERLHVHLIGTVDPAVVRTLEWHPELRGRYTITPWLAHAELVKCYAEADCLLLCPNNSDNARSQINGKLFEYLAVRKPILHIGPYEADNTRILDEAHAGLTVPPGDVDGARAAVKKLYDGTFGASKYAYNGEVIERFERRQTAKQLAALLDKATAKSRPAA